MQRPAWQAFVTTELIPLQYATPSLVGGASASDGGWIGGVLPLAGLGGHAWDRVSWIDVSGAGTRICVTNVTLEYAPGGRGEGEGEGEGEGDPITGTLHELCLHDPDVPCHPEDVLHASTVSPALSPKR